jgi:hypothetical protein
MTFCISQLQNPDRGNMQFRPGSDVLSTHMIMTGKQPAIKLILLYSVSIIAQLVPVLYFWIKMQQIECL